MIQTGKQSQIPQQILDQVFPGVRASGVHGKSKNAEPVKINLKPGAGPVRIKQYPLKLEVREGVKEIIGNFLQFGLLIESKSEFNTSVLPVKKPDGKSYRLVQDWRALNKITADLHPVVATPYTLLNKLRDNHKWSAVLDFKDTFFCLALAKEGQQVFAFEWENPDTGRKTQLTWVVLPQGFRNSPMIFGNQSAQELDT